MNQSESINELAGALAKAQGQIVPALKDSNNPFFKSSYADLSSVWAACRGPLSANGLAVLQTLEDKDGKLILVTTLAHSSGQWIRSILPIVTQKQDAQSMGSAITYMRRYSLSALVGVVADADDDGEGAMARHTSPAQQKYEQKKTAAQVVAEEKKFITKEEGEDLGRLLSQCSQKFQDKAWKFLTEEANISRFEDMTPIIYSKIKQRALDELSKTKGSEND